MRSITERQFVNGKKYTKAEREAAELSAAFLQAKYKAARKFFWTIWRFKLTYRPLRPPFDPFYLADKLTQNHTFGKYDANRPERGSRIVDYASLYPCPTWFSKPVEVDKDR